jgi:hypothetical protein
VGVGVKVAQAESTHVASSTSAQSPQRGVGGTGVGLS